MALRKVKKKLIRGSILLVIRLKYGIDYENIDFTKCNTSDIFINSKPCPICSVVIQKYILKYGLRCVYYS
jgi:hypothetical protein